MMNCEFVFNEDISIFPLRKSNVGFFYLEKEKVGILELRNRVTQNDVTLRVTKSKIFI